MGWVIEHSPHKGSELLCLLMVANHAHADGTGAYMSEVTLARECRMSVRQIRRILNRLKASGALRVDHLQGSHSTPGMTVAMDASADNLTADSQDILGRLTGHFGSSQRTFRVASQDIAMSAKPIEPEGTIHEPGVGADAPRPGKRVHLPVDGPFKDQLVQEYADRLGGPDRVRKAIEKFLNNKASRTCLDKRERLRQWLEEDAEKYQGQSKNGRTGPPGTPAQAAWLRAQSQEVA